MLNHRFRTSPFFQLKEWNALSRHDRHLLQELSGSGEVYGVFRPVHEAPHLTAKLAYTDTALLYFHFQKEGYLPECFANRPEETVNQLLAHLVLDQVLEVEWKGTFVSGSDAVEAIYGNPIFPEHAVPSLLSALSLNVISNAFLLRHREVKALAQWLYTANTWPWEAASKQHFFDSEPLYPFLLSKCNSDIKQQLEKEWRRILPYRHFSWFSWVRAGAYSTGSGPTFKLYISPSPAQVPEVFATLAARLSAGPAFCFKAGATLQGILRPDKLVAYFTNKGDLLNTAATLTPHLAAFQVQGVPFTSGLDQRGMLSWGIDPPPDEVLEAVEDGSWRTTVTTQLALAILQAKKGKLHRQSALPFLKAKLYAAGINMADWTATEEQA